MAAHLSHFCKALMQGPTLFPGARALWKTKKLGAHSCCPSRSCSGGVVGYHACLTRMRSRVRSSARVRLPFLAKKKKKMFPWFWSFCARKRPAQVVFQGVRQGVPVLTFWKQKQRLWCAALVFFCLWMRFAQGKIGTWDPSTCARTEWMRGEATPEFLDLPFDGWRPSDLLV